MKVERKKIGFEKRAALSGRTPLSARRDCTAFLIMCHCEPVTDVTGVAIRAPVPKAPLPKGFLQEMRCAGRCGERTERCQWQRKRSERVAAVKISSVRRKAAQKFWAPQQDHRPLRKRISGCVGEGLCPSRGRPQGSPLRKRYKGCGEESPSHGFTVPAPFRQGGL